MKTTRRQLKQIIKEEIKRIIKENGEQRGWPVSGHYRSGEPYEYGSYGEYQGSDIGRPGRPWLTSTGHEIEGPTAPRSEEAPVGGSGMTHAEMLAAAFPPGKTGGGIPSYEYDPADIEPETELAWGAVGDEDASYVTTGNAPWNESRERRVQRIIQEELHAILNEQGYYGAYDIVEPDIPGWGPPMGGSTAGDPVTGFEPEEFAADDEEEPETDPVYGVEWDQPVGDPTTTRYLHMAPDTAGVPSGGGRRGGS